jgi:hypothetical protein
MHKIKLYKGMMAGVLEDLISESCPDDNCEKHKVRLYYSTKVACAICPKCQKDLFGQILKEGPRKRIDYFFDGKV